jgi:sugar (pentulose or hexulose) kinase
MTAAFGGEEKLLKEAGNLIAPGYTASKILWLKKTWGDLYGKMRVGAPAPRLPELLADRTRP